MVWNALTEGFAEALRAAGMFTPERLARLELAIPRETAHGDWTTNVALALAREVKRPPRAVADALAQAYPLDRSIFASLEIAGPGFLNFRYADAFLSRLPAMIRSQGPRFGHADHAGGLKVQVEYVSANPTGPMNVVNARAGAVGASLVRLLDATGHEAAGEFYVNDAGNQVELLGESVAARFAETVGIPRPFPANGYAGQYIGEIARELPAGEAREALAAERLDWFRDRALERMLEWQRRDLTAYGAEYARWFRESELHRSGAVERTLAELEQRGMTYRARLPENFVGDRPTAEGAESREEATYLRTVQFGDDMDRVIVRGNGVPTYLLPDIAYHRDKRARGFRKVIDIWGPDHHGYIPRMKAALAALGLEDDFLEVLIAQQVNLLSHGQPVKMSKRAGEFITLEDLIEEVGADCAKFFFLMRSTSAHLDFDLDLAKQQNDENPAYYVQYAHARICSILRYAEERGAPPPPIEDDHGASPPPEPEEVVLLRKLATFPEVIRGAAFAREPHRLPAFLIETAAEFHRFYHACRVVTDDAALTRRRLAMVDAARVVVANGLALMGVTAPERMERPVEASP